MAETMKAACFHTYGGPEVLQIEQAPRPTPGDGQVLIRIHAASVNPIDWKLRDGMLKDFVPLQFPATSGQDLAGVIEAVGPSVAAFRPGDAVFAMAATGVMGAHAQYVVLDEKDVAPKPKTLDFVHAASVPMGALTAWQGLVEAGGLKAGDRVFVHAAAGNVGGMAVQIAHALGARVTAAASAEARDVVIGYAADVFVDYQTQRFEEVVEGMDVVFDVLGGEMQKRSWPMLAANGILVSTVGIGDHDTRKTQGVRAAGVSCVPSGDQLRRVAEMIDAGKVRTNVGAVRPLDEAAQALEANKTGKSKGKIVLSIA